MADEKNHFLYKQQYPDTLSILTGQKIDLPEFCKNAIFVLDTNSLLVPYNLGQESLDEIKRIYQIARDEERLFVPAHTLREFAKHRSSKISELFTEVDKALSSIPSIKDLNYPILGELEAYKKLLVFKSDFTTFIKPYKEILQNLQESINEWNWFDPVTQLYHDIFIINNIIDTNEDEVELIKQFEERMQNGTPPGNKDSSKDTNAIGDFLIWKSILELGKSKNVNIVLITNDEKNDWMLKGNKKSISTRFELVDEYRRHTGGHQFTCLNFADFLKIQGALPAVVTEVKTVAISNTISQNSKTLEVLEAIKSIINTFLISNNNYEDNYIPDSKFEQLVTEFSYLWQKDYPPNSLISGLANNLYTIDSKLKQMIELNYNIYYQVIRMKRNTNIDQRKLEDTAREVVSLIDEFMFLMELL